ncbi:PREDICTED: uclacyanin 1-like [Camelina sativa]|uniref:Uclacyanin 1-like n=1 Tax=Camelina sativa TaxID=90675 RepID=A0ABM0WQ50_CAMSA|nr:PREDICTED: uclacyanin 1-like [Camelina sativa]
MHQRKIEERALFEVQSTNGKLGHPSACFLPELDWLAGECKLIHPAAFVGTPDCWAGTAYNNNFHDVVVHDVTEVTHNDFEMCESSKPLMRYTSGSDSISLTKPGLQQFICGVPGHCMSGQKLQIHVLPASLGPVAAPVPRPVRSPSSSSSPSPANAPQYQHQMAPSPLQSGASKLASWIGFSLLALILAF